MGKWNVEREMAENELLVKARDNEYQHALNDLINKFDCESDSFWVLQNLVDMYSKGLIKRSEVSE